jgi:hypothetical protein
MIISKGAADNRTYNGRRINLQLFAEGGEPSPTPAADTSAAAPEGVPATDQSGGQPAPAPEQSQMSVEDRVDELFRKAATGDQNQSNNQQPQQQQASETQSQEQQQGQEQQNQQQENLILGKFKSPEDVFKGYANLEQDYTRKSQTLSETQKVAENLKSENALLMAKLNEFTNSGSQDQNGSQEGQGQQAQQDDLSEIMGLDSDSFLNQLYEKPQETLAKFAEAIAKKTVKENITSIEQKVNPLIEKDTARETQTKWDNATMNFVNQHPDTVKFKDGISEYIKKNGLQNSSDPDKVLNDAYVYARGLNYQEPKPFDFNEAIKDENFVAENILKNEELKNMILKSHMQQIKDTNSPMTLPPGQGGGGQPPAAPPNKAKSVEEAHNMVEALFRGRHA